MPLSGRKDVCGDAERGQVESVVVDSRRCLLGPAAIASGCCRVGQSVTLQKKLSVKSLPFCENEAVWKRTEVYS